MSRILTPRNFIRIGLMSATLLGYSVAANAQTTHNAPATPMSVSTAMLSPAKTAMPMINPQQQSRINATTRASVKTDWALSQTTFKNAAPISQRPAITPLPTQVTLLPLNGDYMKTDLRDLTVPLLGPVNFSVMQDVTPLRFTNITRNRGAYAQSPDFNQNYDLSRYTQSTSATAQVKFKF